MSWARKLMFWLTTDQTPQRWTTGLDWLFVEHAYRHREQHRATDEGMPERAR